MFETFTLPLCIWDAHVGLCVCVRCSSSHTDQQCRDLRVAERSRPMCATARRLSMSAPRNRINCSTLTHTTRTHAHNTRPPPTLALAQWLRSLTDPRSTRAHISVAIFGSNSRVFAIAIEPNLPKRCGRSLAVAIHRFTVQQLVH